MRFDRRKELLRPERPNLLWPLLHPEVQYDGPIPNAPTAFHPSD